MQSRRSRLEKPPWRDLPQMQGKVDEEFLWPLYLGESIAPYRLLSPLLTVLPWVNSEKRLLDANDLTSRGLRSIADWMREVETRWKTNGRSQMSLIERWDYHRELSSQMPPAPIRVFFSASGTQPAAALIADDVGIAEHKLYWAKVATEDEARYLIAILNSETVRGRITHLQSRGQWGARDFDKVMFSLPIPTYDPSDALHQELALAASQAEVIAAGVSLTGITHFVRVRQQIREALRTNGIATHIDTLVATLLGP